MLLLAWPTQTEASPTLVAILVIAGLLLGVAGMFLSSDRRAYAARLTGAAFLAALALAVDSTSLRWVIVLILGTLVASEYFILRLAKTTMGGAQGDGVLATPDEIGAAWRTKTNKASGNPTKYVSKAVSQTKELQDDAARAAPFAAKGVMARVRNRDPAHFAAVMQAIFTDLVAAPRYRGAQFQQGLMIQLADGKRALVDVAVTTPDGRDLIEVLFTDDVKTLTARAEKLRHISDVHAAYISRHRGAGLDVRPVLVTLDDDAIPDEVAGVPVRKYNLLSRSFVNMPDR